MTDENVTVELMPKKVRLWIYLILALGNAVVSGLAVGHTIDPSVALILANVSAVFGFTLAASNVK